MSEALRPLAPRILLRKGLAGFSTLVLPERSAIGRPTVCGQASRRLGRSRPGKQARTVGAFQPKRKPGSGPSRLPATREAMSSSIAQINRSGIGKGAATIHSRRGDNLSRTKAWAQPIRYSTKWNALLRACTNWTRSI